MSGINDHALVPGGSVSLCWKAVPVELITTRDTGSDISPAHVRALKTSFALLGGQLQLQPIVLDSQLLLIDGAHRLEAARQSNWSHIAAVIITGAAQIDRELIEAEVNRVRRRLSVLELELVWSNHYEPRLRAEARQRQLSGLRQRTRVAQASPLVHCSDAILPAHGLLRSPQDMAGDTVGPVIGNSNDEGDVGVERGETREPVDHSESLARAAKRITGFSLDTLKKVAQIRALSTAEGVPSELRRAAESGLARLAEPGASVEPVHRALRNLQQRLQLGEMSAEAAKTVANVAVLERMLIETSLLAERFDGSLSEQVLHAARVSQPNREMLRAARVALTHSLAAAVSLECNLEREPARALQRIGVEVTQLLAKISRSKLDQIAPVKLKTSGNAQTQDGGKERAKLRTMEREPDRAAA